MNQSEFDS